MMFNIGDVIIYSAQGLCKIDDICEKEFFDEKKTYYVMHPLDNPQLTIHAPVHNEKVLMLKTMNKQEAQEIIESFREPGIEWIEDFRKRASHYEGIIKSGDRKEIARIANTLIRKNNELKEQQKKLYEQDRNMLQDIEDILFKEIAIALDITLEEVCEEVEKLMN